VHLASSLPRRFLSRQAARLFAQNAVAGTASFVFGLFLMWLCVDVWAINDVWAAGLSFLTATSVHYVIARTWVFRGTKRRLALGYGYFLVNAGVGLLITVLGFAALMRWTAMNYLVARTVVSVVAGVAIFVLNASLNFKRL
jgi:putative flippase GtrA